MSAGIQLDASVKAVLDAIRDSTYADLDTMPIEQAMLIARPPASTITRPPPPHSEDRTLAGFGGARIPVRLYYPGEIRPAKLPVLVHLHGGGFVAGTIEQDDARCTCLAREVQCIVVSVGYRLAPESVFPIAIEDAFAAWLWVTTQAGVFGGDAGRCAISGSSAGGHLAVGVTLLARARNARRPMLQLLTYPVINPRVGTPSYRDFGDGPFLTRARMAWYWKQYAGAPASRDSELWNPMLADAAGLPPAYVITGEYDVLRDEGEAYAAHLRAAGVEATIDRYPRMIHGFITVVPQHDASKAALRQSAIVLRKAFAGD